MKIRRVPRHRGYAKLGITLDSRSDSGQERKMSEKPNSRSDLRDRLAALDTICAKEDDSPAWEEAYRRASIHLLEFFQDEDAATPPVESDTKRRIENLERYYRD